MMTILIFALVWFLSGNPMLALLIALAFAILVS